MQYFIKTLCFLLFINFQYLGLCQCLNVEISLNEVNTQKIIGNASLWASNGIKRTTLGKTTTGTTMVSIPCDAKTLFVEATGYRPLSISLNIDANKSDKINWLLPLLMVANDQQVSDKPYSQQEQTFFEMKDSTKKGVPFAIRNFTVTDAITQIPLSASVCLYYTKNQQKNCFEVVKNQSKEIKFQEKDIVALEVNSLGYQAFNGNLIVDKLDAQKSLYEIKLSQELTILSLTFKETEKPFNCLLMTNKKTIPLKKVANNRFYAYGNPNETYQLKVMNDRRDIVFEGDFNLKKGFNIQFITLKFPEVPRVSVPTPPAIVSSSPPPINNPVIPVKAAEEKTNPLIIKEKFILMFNQSDFKLHKDSEQILDGLSNLLLQNPKSFARIVGHSDNVGSVTQNKRLSELRTMVVCNYLSAKGIEEKRFFMMGLGSTRAASSNDTEESRAKNRRVEIQLIE